MLNLAQERTFISVIIPKGASHILTCLSTCFMNTIELINYYCLCLSLIADFLVKSTGSGHANMSLIKQLPILHEGIKFKSNLHIRSLMLTCLTFQYQELWSECWNDDFKFDTWTKSDPRLTKSFFKDLSPDWARNCAVRTDYSRRQALVEIDVLAALAFCLTLDELKTIYRVQFPVIRQYEDNTWYDQKGRIVFTCSKGLPGVGLSRPEWDAIRDMKEGRVERKVVDDTIPGGPVERTIAYHAPFDRCDREKDYETAWKEFERRFKDKEVIT